MNNYTSTFKKSASSTKSITLVLVALCLSISLSAKSALIHVDAQAGMTSGLPFTTTYLTIGTVVTASVDFDIGPGTPASFPSISSASGTFTWNDGIARVFNVGSASIVGVNSSGNMTFDFPGTGPTIGGLTPATFRILINIGVNPFTTASDLATLLPGSTVSRLRVGVTDGSGLTQFGDLMTNVSGTVTAVPLPAALWFFATGLLGLMGMARKKPA